MRTSSTTRTIALRANGNEVRQGVEVDAWGRPVGYWIWNHHPTDYSRGTRVREFVPADQIVHQFIRRRAGQTMGVPWFAPVLIDERMLQGFQEASVTNARVGATNTFFLKMNPEAASEPGVKALDADINLEAEPGVGQILPPGYDVAQWNPKYPNAEFDPFRTAILGSLATGLRVSHMTLTGDLSGANYSSMRAGLLPERDAWRLLHGWHTRGFHRRVYRAWLRAGVLAGAIDVAPRDLEKVLRADTWQTRGFPWVDPQADIQARLMEVDAGINTLTNICAEEGRDFEESSRFGSAKSSSPRGGRPDQPRADARDDVTRRPPKRDNLRPLETPMAKTLPTTLPKMMRQVTIAVDKSRFASRALCSAAIAAVEQRAEASSGDEDDGRRSHPARALERGAVRALVWRRDPRSLERVGRLTRAQDGLPLLLDHNTRDQIGLIEDVSIDGDKVMRGMMRFSKSARAQEILGDVLDGIRTKASVGYQVKELVLEKSDKKSGIDTYRVSEWCPMEGSIVADPGGSHRRRESDARTRGPLSGAHSHPRTRKPIGLRGQGAHREGHRHGGPRGCQHCDRDARRSRTRERRSLTRAAPT
jgi:hypothetical protein